MKIALIVIGIIVLVVLLFGGQLIGIRNELATLKNQIDGSWSAVDSELQRRADLIPNLVATVKGFAAHEKGVIDAIANARAALLAARGNPQQSIEANAQLDRAIGRLLVVVENYPQLKANENFLRLQDELASTENRIAQARRRYNESVQQYNTKIDLFPNNIAASLFGFQRNDAYFRTDPGARNAPKVAF